MRVIGPAVVGLVTLIALTGCSGTTGAQPAADSANSGQAAATASPSSDGGWSSRSSARIRATTVAAPTRISLPSIDVTAPIEPVEVSDDGVLGVPERPTTVGWWARGASPTDAQGTVVLDVHLDSRRYGRGPFGKATQLEDGDVVTVTDSAGQRHGYRVTSVDTYRKTALPYDELFAQTGPARMVLVTCGGTYRRDAGGWDSNVVVTFEPVDPA